MATLDQAAVRKLVERAHREIDAGLLPSCQLALALDGEVVLDETIGDAGPDTRYVFFSATKPFVAATLWALIGDGVVDPALPVTEYVPGFGTNGKDVVTVEQVMLHTAGFPAAPLAPLAGATSAGRRAAFGRWRLNWEPGSRYEYHPTSAHWVLAEIIEQVTGGDFRDVVAERVTGPAGLPRVLGQLPWRAAPLVLAGGVATPDELQSAFGVRALPVTEVTSEALLAFNDPAVQAVGVPGGGGVMRASDVARFYQAVLRNPGEIWRPDVLADVVGHVRNRLPDPLTRTPRTARSASCRRATTGSPTCGASGAPSRRAPSVTTGRVASSPGPIPRPACPSPTAPTGSTSTPSASPAAAPPCRASPGRASPSEPCLICASSQTTSGWPSAGNASTAWRWGRA